MDVLMNACRGSVAALLVFVGQAASAVQWTVRAWRIHRASIAHAKAGDVILVKRGYYLENLVIEKPLTLRGIDRPTISGNLKAM